MKSELLEPQPFLLKNIYSEGFLQQVANHIQSVYSEFDIPKFLTLVFNENWKNLELKQRMRHISHCLRECLPPNFKDSTSVLIKTTKKLLKPNEENMAFEWAIFPDFIEAFGVEEPKVSLSAMEVITQLASAEFAIRPFLLRYPEKTTAQMVAWSKHPHAMVRRLSSEGFRPRLPWGMGIPILKKDPTAILPILETLKKDPAETVRRSVANNLNDISKDHPDLVLEIATRWIGDNMETDWVVRHACRGLLKKGNAIALALFGMERGAEGIEIINLSADEAVRIGEKLNFSFSLNHFSSKEQKIRLEYAIHYQTLSGIISKKVFKIKELVYEANVVENIKKQQWFKDFTTRKHFPGQHRLEIIVNGEVLTNTSFEVLRER